MKDRDLFYRFMTFLVAPAAFICLLTSLAGLAGIIILYLFGVIK